MGWGFQGFNVVWIFPPVSSKGIFDLFDLLSCPRMEQRRTKRSAAWNCLLSNIKNIVGFLSQIRVRMVLHKVHINYLKQRFIISIMLYILDYNFSLMYLHHVDIRTNKYIQKTSSSGDSLHLEISLYYSSTFIFYILQIRSLTEERKKKFRNTCWTPVMCYIVLS